MLNRYIAVSSRYCDTIVVANCKQLSADSVGLLRWCPVGMCVCGCVCTFVRTYALAYGCTCVMRVPVCICVRLCVHSHTCTHVGMYAQCIHV